MAGENDGSDRRREKTFSKFKQTEETMPRHPQSREESRKEWFTKRCQDVLIRAAVLEDTDGSGGWVDRIPKCKIPTWARGNYKYPIFKRDVRKLAEEYRGDRARPALADPDAPTEEEREQPDGKSPQNEE